MTNLLLYIKIAIACQLHPFLVSLLVIDHKPEKCQTYFSWGLHFTGCEALGNLQRILWFKLKPLSKETEKQELRGLDYHQAHTLSLHLNFYFCRN